MPRPSSCERRFELADQGAPQGWAGIALSSPLGLGVLVILVAGALATMAPPGQAGAETPTTAVAVLNVDTASLPDVGRRTVTAAEIHGLVSDPAIRDFKGLSENAWDFTDPNGLPGFGRLPEAREELRVTESARK